MKKTLILCIMLCVLVPSAFAEVSSADKKELQDQVYQIADALNDRNIEGITALLSPNARPGLREEIEASLGGKYIRFSQSITGYEELSNSKVKVTGRYSAAGQGWSINGLSNYYIFEKVNNSWLLADTDFHQKVGSDYVFDVAGKIMMIVLPLAIIFGIVFGGFWLWMLVDALSRTYENKVAWAVVVFVLGFVGAVVYFFAVRRKLIQNNEKSKGIQKNLRNS